MVKLSNTVDKEMIRCVFVPYDMGEDPGSQWLHGEWRIQDSVGMHLGTLPNKNTKKQIVVFIKTAT